MREPVVNERPIRDLGRLAVMLLARPLAAYMNSGDRGSSRYTVDEVRADARVRPATQPDAATSSGSRFLAWVAIGAPSLALYIVAALARPRVDLGRGVLVAVMVVTCVIALFAGVAMFLQVVRLTIIHSFGWRGFPAATHRLTNKLRDDRERRRREVLARRGPHRFVRWLSTTSHLDSVLALIWVLLLAPLIVADIPV